MSRARYASSSPSPSNPPPPPANLTLGLDNYGSEGCRTLQAQANARVNDIFGMFESTDILVVTNPAAPDQLAFVNWAQPFPIGTTGFSFNYFVGQPHGRRLADCRDWFSSIRKC